MTGEGRQRLDRWLFFARIVKSRTLAARLVEAGKVRVNREKCTQPSQQLKPGDVLTLALDRRVLVLKILAPGTRRGPAPEARLLYEELGRTGGPAAPPDNRPQPGPRGPDR